MESFEKSKVEKHFHTTQLNSHIHMATRMTRPRGKTRAEYFRECLSLNNRFFKRSTRLEISTDSQKHLNTKKVYKCLETFVIPQPYEDYTFPLVYTSNLLGKLPPLPALIYQCFSPAF